ncbi:MAG: hypothetical protein ACRDZ3_19380 [Acidimicrobiia bacterium]
MFKRSRKVTGLIGLALIMALVGAACGEDSPDEGAADETTSTQAAAGEAEQTAATGSTTGAATLRAGLTGLLSEHVYLAALATGAALRGDNAAFEAYAAALNGPTNSNTADIVAGMTAAYGDEVGKAFDGLWRSNGHIPAFVAYTQAIAKDDKAGADKAVADLLAYAKTFGTTINSVNANLPAAAVEEGIKMHATTLKAVIDAQKAGDAAAVYTSLRAAYHHMDELGNTLAGATAKQFPDKFDGDAASPASGLRSTLTSLLREHVLLAASATGAALRGDTASFEAAAAALNGPTGSNTADIVAGVTSVYGDEVGKAFDGLWRSNGHISAFVAYTQAIAKDDKAAADKAVADLLAYAKTFGETMNSVNENLPAAAVEEGIKMHATTLKAVIDAQKAKDAPAMATSLRMAVSHMNEPADAIAAATEKKFPEKF